jgi:dTDP-4-amino-4,6-dideoxygalactose transaminase
MPEQDFIPIIKPLMGEPEASAARRAILSGWVTQGPEVAAFEQEFAAFVGAPHACAVSNCTTALHLALLAVGVQPDDEVVTVSHSYIATANSIRYCRAVPVFVDIEPGTYNMDPRLLEDAITPRTRAILCVHQMGMPLDLKAILQVARRRSIRIIEDAACAIGSEIRWGSEWEKIGRPRGDIACFSFHPRKVITTGDGGMLTTSNTEYDAKFRLWRQHSMNLTDILRHSASVVRFEEYPEIGFNYRMTDIQAAVGSEQLRRLPAIVSRRRELAARYQELLTRVPDIVAPEEPAFARSNWQSFCVRLADECDQVEVMQFMLDRGIATRRGIMCSHREAAYRNGGYRAASHLSESEAAQDHSIILPLFHQMTAAHQDRVVETLAQAISTSRRAMRPGLKAS